jgi:hypothetical protein
MLIILLTTCSIVSGFIGAIKYAKFMTSDNPSYLRDSGIVVMYLIASIGFGIEAGLRAGL